MFKVIKKEKLLNRYWVPLVTLELKMVKFMCNGNVKNYCKGDNVLNIMIKYI